MTITVAEWIKLSGQLPGEEIRGIICVYLSKVCKTMPEVG